nr:MAG TPA: hypothetical protein [Caudoviricetes sp.]
MYRFTARYIIIKQLKCSISEKQSQFWLSDTQLQKECTLKSE